MTFDEVIEIIWGNTLGIDASDEPGKKDFIIKDDTVATGREALTFLIRELKDTYAPTIEMKEYQYRFIQDSDSIVDVVGNVTVDGLLKEFFDESFWAPLKQQQVVSAWLHPDTIKVVD